MPLSAVNLSFPIAAVFAGISGGGGARAAERLPVSIAAVSALANGGAEAWSDKAGLPAADAGAFLNYGIPSAEVTIWTGLSTGTLGGLKSNLDRIGRALVITAAAGMAPPADPFALMKGKTATDRCAIFDEMQAASAAIKPGFLHMPWG